MRSIICLGIAVLVCTQSFSQVLTSTTTTISSVKITTFVIPSGYAKSDSQLVADIQAAYNTMERNVEMMYDKLKKDARDDIDELNDKIKSIQAQISSLQNMAAKIAKVIEAMEHLMDSLKQVKNVTTNVKQLNLLTFKIDSVNKEIQWQQDKIQNLNKQIAQLQIQISGVKDQITQLEAQIARLEADKKNCITQIEKQKQAAIQQAIKMAEERKSTSLNNLYLSSNQLISHTADSLQLIYKIQLVQ